MVDHLLLSPLGIGSSSLFCAAEFLGFALFPNAPLTAITRIYGKKTTEPFSGIPSVMGVFSGLLYFALYFVSPNQAYYWTLVNVSYGSFCFILMLFFIKFAPTKERAEILVIFLFSLLVTCLVILVSVFTFHGESRRIFCGFATSISTIVMYASPLFIMGKVMKTKSVRFMPLHWSVKVFLCGIAFFIYGLCIHDPFVAVPNAFGCVLGALQLELYFYHMNSRVEDTVELPQANNVNVL